MICGRPFLICVTWMKGIFTLICDKPKGHPGNCVRPALIDGSDG